MTRRERLWTIAGMVLSLVVAMLAGERALDARPVVGIALAGALAAGGAFLVTRAPRAAAGGGVAASALAFVLVRLASPWTDLGPFGAGPLTAIPLVLFPATQMLGMWVAAAITRAASRRPPSSRRP